MAETLNSTTTDKVYGLLRKAHELAKSDFQSAERLAREAWDALPEPKFGWDCSGSILDFMTKFFRDAKKFDEALIWADRAIAESTLPGDGTPYILKGSVYFEAENLEAARDCFAKAFELSGKRAFQGEDPRYLSLIPSNSKKSPKKPKSDKRDSAKSSALVLSDAAHAEIKRLCALGDEAAEGSDHQKAIGFYKDALALVPEPKTNWEAATWIFAALADVQFRTKDWAESLNNANFAIQAPGGLANPFIYLRRGQARLELGQEADAADDLARAYMAAGKEIFEGEDPKYWQFVTSHLQPPTSGGW